MSKKVLIVDDSLYMRTIISEVFSSEDDYEVVGLAGDGETAIDMAFELKPDLITLDNILPDMLGLDIIRTLKEECLESKIIMVSAVGQQSVINAGLELGADNYIVKPFTPDQLLEVIKKVLN